MRFDVLGPLRVWGDDGPLRLQQGRALMVLSYLLLRANESVSPLSMGRALWPDEAADRARLHARAGARDVARALGPGRLTGGASVSLRVDPESIDAYRFERMADQARSSLTSGDIATAKSLLLQGLSLWRGGAFSELAGVDAAIPEIERLESGRGDALEDLYGIELRGTVSYALVARLRAEVVTRPLRPRLWRQLALALYRTGRQTEALAAARESSSVLGRGDPAMADLESAMLHHDAALERGELPPGAAPSSSPGDDGG